MKKLLTLIVLTVSLNAGAQMQKAPEKPWTLKTLLLEQLRTTHNKKDWFVDANTAVAGLSPEQASWKDGKGNHSAGQLAYHLVFWNQRELTKFKGEEPSKFSGNNEETFDKFDAKQWSTIVKQLDEVMADWEKAVEAADETKLAAWYDDIAHIGTHNAYHIGQIVFVRKQQGSWDPEKGVK